MDHKMYTFLCHTHNNLPSIRQLSFTQKWYVIPNTIYYTFSACFQIAFVIAAL